MHTARVSGKQSGLYSSVLAVTNITFFVEKLKSYAGSCEMSGKKEGNIDFIFTWIVSYDQDVGFWFHFVPEITALLQKKRGNEMHKVAIVLKLDSKTFHSGAKTFIKLHYVLSYFKGYKLTNWRIPKEFQKDAKIILKKFRKISKRIPKEFQKNSERLFKRIPKGFGKTCKRIPKQSGFFSVGIFLNSVFCQNF